MVALFFLLPLLSLLGFAHFFAITWGVRSRYSFFVATSFMGTLATLFAVAGVLRLGSWVLLVAGWAALVWSYYALRQEETKLRCVLLKNSAVFIFLLFVLSFFAVGVTENPSIDFFAHWSFINKFVSLNDALPNAPFPSGVLVDQTHLAYTPGLATFQYLFQVSGHYSVWAAFTALDALMLSFFMVFFDDEKRLSQQIFLLCIMYGFLAFFKGGIFTYMAADRYVIVLFVSLSVAIYEEESPQKLLFVLALPITYLYLIKQMGLFSGVVVALCYLAAFWKSSIPRKKLILYTLMLLTPLLMMKGVWVLHYRHAGFTAFDHAITWKNALSSLNPFNATFQPLQKMYISDIFFSGASRLIRQIPNFSVYVFFFFLTVLCYGHINNKDKVFPMFSVFFTSLLVYVIALYVFEAIVFKGYVLGLISKGHGAYLPAAGRYLNLYLVPMYGWIFYVYLTTRIPFPSQKTLKAAIIAAVLLLIGGYIYHKRSNGMVLFRDIVEAIKSHTPDTSPLFVCVDSIELRNQILRFQYYSLSTQQNLRLIFSDQHKNHLCDYFLVFSEKPSSRPYPELKEVFKMDFTNNYPSYPYKRGYVFFLKGGQSSLSPAG